MKYQPYIDEVEKMEKAEVFADQLPLFRDVILSQKMTWYSEHTKFWNKYKNIYLSWWINRLHFTSWTPRNITNLKAKYDVYLYEIYVNTYSLYDSNENHWLEELAKIELVYYFDISNSKFYITDEWIEIFLEALNEWYLKAIDLANEEYKMKQIKELQRQIDSLNK